MLAITGARADGFHELVSLVAPTKAGDSLSAKISESGADSITCNMPDVPLNSDNLVIKAAEYFREKMGIKKYFDFGLHKTIPAGAGLGGGSSNGATALDCVNELCGGPLGLKELSELAAKMGSDCPLFLNKTPIVMRGRGEEISELNTAQSACVRGLELLIFKPAFSINTGWAYTQMREDKTSYIPKEEAEAMLLKWLIRPTIESLPLFNNMQIAAFKKFPALTLTIQKIKDQFGLPAMMSGSGSACFAIINGIADDEAKVSELKKLIASCLGESCFIARG